MEDEDYKIFCDESGYTGVGLLEEKQPYFVYSGVRLSAETTNEISQYIKANYPVQSEIKGKHLVKNEKGKKVLLHIFEKYGHLARIVFFDKKLALASKIFEYAIEPNLLSNGLIYKTKFNIYIADKMYDYFTKTSTEAETIFTTFLEELRGIKKRTIFSIDHSNIENDAVSWMFDIVKSNPDNFYKSISKDDVRWLGFRLNINRTFSILTDWSKTHGKLEVVCDESNLLKNGDILLPLNSMGLSGKTAELLDDVIGFELTKEISLAKSKEEPGLEIADIFASTVGYALNNKADEFSKKIIKYTFEKTICNPSFCIFPSSKNTYSKEQIDFYKRLMRIINEYPRK